MDVLTFDVALAAKLKKAMNHFGWKEEDINALAESRKLAQILEVVRGKSGVLGFSDLRYGNHVRPTVNWACYWSLKLMQQELGCSEVEIYAAEGLVDVSPIDERESGLAYLTVVVRRWPRSGYTSVKCHLTRNQEGSWWITQMEYSHDPIRGKKRALRVPFRNLETKLPGYSMRGDISFKEEPVPERVPNHRP